MKIKNKLHIFFASVALTLCISCEDLKFGDAFLDKPLTTDITIDTIFAHKKYADQVLAEVYLSLPDFLVSDGRLAWSVLESLTDLGDIAVTASLNRTYYTGAVSSATDITLMPYRLDDHKVGDDLLRNSSPMGAMRTGYIYLNNIDRVPDMTDSEKQIRKAEVKTIMAFHYTQMLRYYGGMPWVDRAYNPEDKVNLTRMTVEEHVAKVVNLCDEAANVLPWTVSASDEGHMTAASALAVKNRVLQFAASPLFNAEQPYLAGEASDAHYTWYGNYSAQRWQDALDAALELLDKNKENSDYYELVNTGNPRKDFLTGYYERHNTEVLLVGHRYTKIDNSWYAACQMARWGNYVPSAVLADMYETSNGEAFDWNNPEHAKTPFFDADGNLTRDPRLYETVWVNGDAFRGRKCELWEGGREAYTGNGSVFQKSSYNGYGLRKFILDQDTELKSKFYQCPHIRLSEIYLNIAEAMNALGKANEKDRFGRDAYDYINLVRNRVNMPDINKSKYPAGDALQEAILHERAVEFAFEEVRYFDINRWKRKDLLETPRYRLHTTKLPNGSMKYENKDDVFIKDRVWVDLWDNRYYLLPIPVAEINKNYGLVQNPGW